MEPIRFELKDREGNTHQYEQPWFPPKHTNKMIATALGLVKGELDPTKLADIIADDNGIIDRLFKGLRRDGKLVDRESGRIDAYTGNIGEMWQAIREIVQRQIVPFLPEEFLNVLSAWSQSPELPPEEM